MKKLFVLILTSFFTIICYAQKLTLKEWESIQASNQYLIGMGLGASIDEARQTALSDLAGKISVKVSSQFDYLETTDPERFWAITKYLVIMAN